MEIEMKIKRMPQQELKKFDRGVWKVAYYITFDNWKTYFQIAPNTKIIDIIEVMKIEKGEI